MNFPDHMVIGRNIDLGSVLPRTRCLLDSEGGDVRCVRQRAWPLLLVVWSASLGLLPNCGLAQSDLELRRQRIESLSPSEKRELIAKMDRFERLPDAEKERLRQLDKQINNHPQATQLRQVLERYGQWLSTLSSKDRAELQELPPLDRLARIQELRQNEQDRRLSKCGLTAQDANTVFQWWDRLAEQNEPLLVKSLPDKERGDYERMPANDPRRGFMLRVWVGRSLEQLLENVPRDDTNRLIEQLQKTAREQFLKLESPTAENELLAKWIRESVRYRFRPPVASDDELLGMINRLPPDEQERLEKLPRDELVQILRERWESQQIWRQSRSPRRGFHRGPDERRGPDDRRRPDERFRSEDRPDFPGPPAPPGERGFRPNGFEGPPPRFDENGRPETGPPREPPPADPVAPPTVESAHSPDVSHD